MSSDLSVPAKLPLLDENGQVIDWIDEEHARGLIKLGAVTICRTRRKVRALRFRDEVSRRMRPEKPGSLRKRGAGDSHNRETEETNIAGVWTIERVPDSVAPIFRAVALGCIKRAA